MGIEPEDFCPSTRGDTVAPKTETPAEREAVFQQGIKMRETRAAAQQDWVSQGGHTKAIAARSGSGNGGVGGGLGS